MTRDTFRDVAKMSIELHPRSASSVGGVGGTRGSGAHAQFGMMNVVVVGDASASSSSSRVVGGSGKVFGLDLVAHLRDTGRERE